MPIDFSKTMLDLSPTRPIDLGSFGGGSMERERMRLMREQFEETKRQNAESNRLREQAQQEQTARARLAMDKQREKAAQAAQAQLTEKRQGAMQKAGEYGGTGNAEALEASVPYMQSLGMGVEALGSVGGLPSYRIRQDASAPEPDTGIGYPTDERGTLEQPAPISSSDQEVAPGVTAAQAFESARQGDPLRQPEGEDFTGAVPKDVIDMGSIQAQTLARLNPALKDVTSAYPTEQGRESAAATARGVSGLGLPAAESMKMYDQLRGGPDAAINTETLTADRMAQKESDRAAKAAEPMKPIDQENMREFGRKRASEAYKNSTIKESVGSMEAADTIEDTLNGDPRNHEKVINYLMAMTKNKGHQTEQDALRVIGGGQASTWNQARDYIFKKFKGGFSPEQRNAIMEFVNAERDKDRDRVYDYMDNMGKQIEAPDNDELVRSGYRAFIDSNIPVWLREQYDDDKSLKQDEEKPVERQPQGSAEPGQRNYSAMSDFDLELEAASLENDLDADKLKPIIGHESGGSATATSKAGAVGIIQFMPAVAEALGTSSEELAQMSPSEQIPYAMDYLKRKGITAESRPEDYALAVAAPAAIGKPDDSVVYPRGSKAWEMNRAWRPPSGGDITVGSILSFYGLRGKGQNPPKAKKAVDQDVLDILRGP